MVRPTDDEVAQLVEVAREIRGSADESAHRVGRALDQHKAFILTRGPASSMERSLVLDAARRGASRAGLWAHDVAGGLEIIAMSDVVVRRYRVKGMSVDAAGRYRVICGRESSLLVSEPDALVPEEKWVLGFVTSDDHTVEHLVAAEIVGWEGEGPVRLELGTVIRLLDDQSPGGFTSTDEGLTGFDEDGDEWGGAGWA